MALHVRLDINGEVIGDLEIVRRRTAGHKALYSYEFDGNRGKSKGYVWHQLRDGANILASKVLEEAERNLEGGV